MILKFAAQKNSTFVLSIADLSKSYAIFPFVENVSRTWYIHFVDNNNSNTNGKFVKVRKLYDTSNKVLQQSVFFHTYSIDEKMIPAIKTKVVYKLSGCCFESRCCHLKTIRFV